MLVEGEEVNLFKGALLKKFIILKIIKEIEKIIIKINQLIGAICGIKKY